jgi:hypothetical protein
MSIVERLYTGALSTILSAASVGVGYGAEQRIVQTFKDAVSGHAVTGDVVLGTAIALGVTGLALLAASGAVYFGALLSG